MWHCLHAILKTFICDSDMYEFLSAHWPEALLKHPHHTVKIHSTRVHLHRGMQEADVPWQGRRAVRVGWGQVVTSRQSPRLQNVDPTPANKEAVKPQRPENGNSSNLELTPLPLYRLTIWLRGSLMTTLLIMEKNFNPAGTMRTVGSE